MNFLRFQQNPLTGKLWPITTTLISHRVWYEPAGSKVVYQLQRNAGANGETRTKFNSRIPAWVKEIHAYVAGTGPLPANTTFTG
jgi:hypothetical protein